MGVRLTRRRLALGVAMAVLGGLLMTRALPHPALRARTSRKAPAPRLQTFAAAPLSFDANVGQADPRVSFLAHGPNYGIFLTRDEAVVALGSSARARSAGSSARLGSGHGADAASLVRMRFLGANPSTQAQGLERRSARVNYFIGNDRAKWRTDVPSFARVKYAGIYPGIDLVYYGNQSSLEYDLIVAPGARPEAIRLALEGADDARIDSAGDLRLAAAGHELVLRRPRIYQDAGGDLRPIAGSYRLSRKSAGRSATLSIALGAYDHRRPLVIDPQLVHSTFFGGSAGAQPNAIAVDSSGNVYLTGSTLSLDFPVTSNAFQSASKNAAPFFGLQIGTAFVTVLNPAAGQIVYSTYLGGGGVCLSCATPTGDTGCGVAADSQGRIYVAGFTPSLNFPVTPSAFEPQNVSTVTGVSSGFVTLLDPSQTGNAQLVYSTYLGGLGADVASAIAVDSQGLAYVTGNAMSENFPVTANVFEPLKAADGDQDGDDESDGNDDGLTNAFVTILNPAASGAASLVYSSYLGGSSGEDGNGIAVGSSGLVYVTGDTASGDFPTTSNALALNPSGLISAFVTVINPANKGPAQLVYSTHLGGSFVDSGTGIAVDANGRAYVAGFTRSGDFPVTASAFQPHMKAALTSFVSVIDPSMSGAASLAYSTYFGGSGAFSEFLGDGIFAIIDGETRGIAVDSQGLAYIAGWTFSNDFPVSAGAFQPSNAGGADAFVSVLNPALSGAASMVFSSYLGGSGMDAAAGIAVDPSSLVYVAGSTGSANFPVTPDAIQGTKPANVSTGFVAVINPSDPPAADPPATATPTPTSAPTATPAPTRRPLATPKHTPTPKRTATPTPTPHRRPTPTRTPAPKSTPKRAGRIP